MFGLKNYKAALLLLSLFISCLDTWGQTSSVLSSGTWYRLAVTKTGIHKLDVAYLQRLGIPTATLDPKAIRIYGNGGGVLPQPNALARPQDLTENAIWVSGEADGRFNGTDAVYFYAQSPHRVYFDSTAKDVAGPRFTHQINPYSDTTYYFLTVNSGVSGLRLQTASINNEPTAPLITQYDDYYFYEKELTNRVQSGREWYGEYFGLSSEQTFSQKVPGLVIGSPALVTTALLSQGNDTTRFRVRWGSQPIATHVFAPLSDFRYERKGLESRQITRLATTSLADLALTFSYDRGKATNAQAYLNFFAIQFQRELALYDAQQQVRSLESTARAFARYQVKQAGAGLQVWDVTNPLRPLRTPVTMNGADAVFTAKGGQLREFILFKEESTLVPLRAVPVAAQNLRGEATPDLLIISAGLWKTQADRLAAFRRQNDGLDVLVVTTQQVYNEFASGQPDPTALRDFVRYLNTKTPQKLKYLLLMGDASYDYKGITGLLNAAQLASTVPVYESRESLHPVLSFSSDDYFGFLKNEDGEWPENFSGDQRLDIGIGRLPVRSAEEARDVVDKLIRYATDKTLTGDWQTRLAFVADDGDGNIHQTDANLLADRIGSERAGLRTEKIFIDDFPRQSTPTGDRTPTVNQRLLTAMNEGRLIINYSGHGGDSGWAEEQILTVQDILGWRNRRMPLMMTATCEFGRYDNPAVTSGAELALLNRQGGAIGLLTTTRPVYSNTNFILNQAFYETLANTVGAPRLGDLVRETKNKSLAGNLNRNFTLLGDPSMKLALPEASVSITRINGKNVSRPDTLSARELVTLEGIVSQNSQPLTNFNGTALIRVFDKATTLTTLGNKPDTPKMTYQAYQNILFSGMAQVKNGQFSCQFRMPSDIAAAIGHGRIFLYAVRADSTQTAVGGLVTVPIGGVSANTPSTDTKPPVVRLFVNDTTFIDGGTVAGPAVRLFATVSDESGINLTRGISLQLENNTPIDITEYYIAKAGGFQQGRIDYRLPDLKNGTYAVKLNVFDAYNNLAEVALRFIVSDRPGLQIESVSPGPNPFRESVTFFIRHNRSGEDLDVTLTIVDFQGRIVKQQQTECINCPAVWSGLNWESSLPSSLNNTPLLYFYQITITSKNDGSRTKASGKLLYER